MTCPICLSRICSWFSTGECDAPLETGTPIADLCDGGRNSCRCREKQSE